jgi:diguanylate cyclase (GGDEF)-like protein
VYDRAVAGEENTSTLTRVSARGGDDDHAPAPCLIVIRGMNVGASCRLRAGETIIGRGQEAHLDLHEDGVSRRHALVRLDDGGPILADLGSKSGTFVNGRRVAEPVALTDGDKIQVSAGTILKFTYADRLDESFQLRMYESSLRDPLTQSFNRKYFLDRLERELRFARRHGQPVSLIFVDVDGLAAVNDRHGSAAGDAILAQLAERVQAHVRQEDVVARTGGDELGVICRATAPTDAAVVAERIRSAVAQRSFGAAAIAVTVSAGVAGVAGAEHPEDCSGSHELLAATEAALAAVKRDGKNCVRVAR